MQGLKIEGPEANQPQLGTTIFSSVLSTLVEEPEVMETPPEDEALWYTSPPLGLEMNDRYLLVITSSVNQLELGPSGDNVREFQSNRNVFWNPPMLAVFPPQGATHYQGATLTEIDE